MKERTDYTLDDVKAEWNSGQGDVTNGMIDWMIAENERLRACRPAVQTTSVAQAVR